MYSVRRDNAVAYTETPLKRIVIYANTLYSYLLYRLGRSVFAFPWSVRRKRQYVFGRSFARPTTPSPFLFVRTIGNPSSTKTANSYSLSVQCGTRTPTEETSITKSFDRHISNNRLQSPRRGSFRIQIARPPGRIRFHTHFIYARGFHPGFFVWRV